MALSRETTLSREEIDAFLRRKETGVLSLAMDDEPYSIPVSYGYDGDERQFFLRLVSTPDSEKRAFLSSTAKSRLVVYEEDGDTYRSVVVDGTCEELPREELTADLIAQYGEAKRPLFEIWGESKPDLDVKLFRIDPDSISGRRVDVDREAEPPA
jgi:hypothetical protein